MAIFSKFARNSNLVTIDKIAFFDKNEIFRRKLISVVSLNPNLGQKVTTAPGCQGIVVYCVNPGGGGDSKRELTFSF